MTNAISIKGLPLQDLTVVAVAHVTASEHPGDDFPTMEVDLDVIDAAGWSRIENGMPKVTICACCGHRLTYACAVEHTPTAAGYWVGRDCAAKISSLQRFMPAVANLSVALVERAACNARQAAVLLAFPAFAEVVEYAKHSFAPKATVDMVEKMRRYGKLSPEQVAFGLRLVREDKTKRTTATKTVVAGRQTFSGTVLGLKQVENLYGSGPTFKMLVDVGGGVKLWGTKPSSLNVDKGDVVTLTATVAASKNDPLFGLFSRPANASAVRAAGSISSPAPIVQ